MSLLSNDECNECINYVKQTYNDNEWTCEICCLKEQRIKINATTYILWYRYQLKCGHQVHVRCYRKWCKMMNVVGCPSCLTAQQHTPESAEYLYCKVCFNFGHERELCPVRILFQAE